MEKKILLAVDNSLHSRHTVEYAARMSSVAKDLTYTLFYVQPVISQFLLDEARTDSKSRIELEKMIRKNSESGQNLLEKHKAQMMSLGIKDEHINVMTRPRSLGLAKDILDCAQQGLYDALVVGRRGLSNIQKAIIGSVTANLASHCVIIPLWVIDGDVTSSQKILLAVDGSESSLRAVDHLGFMVGGNPKTKITLFHVVPRISDYCVIDFEDRKDDIEKIITQSAKRCIDHFYAHARQKFMKAGIQEDQIEIKVTKRVVNVGKAIIDEAKKANYGTVVVGRKGADNAFFTGSVSKYVLNKISNRALWLVS